MTTQSGNFSSEGDEEKASVTPCGNEAFRDQVLLAFRAVITEELSREEIDLWFLRCFDFTEGVDSSHELREIALRILSEITELTNREKSQERFRRLLHN